MSVPGAPDVRSGATTTTDNVVELLPFQVQNPVAPARWDPQGDPLPFSYEIRDPNRRIRSGRILYEVLHDGLAWVIIHSQRLSRAALEHGPHELPQAERWDGIIHQGIADRNGERVTAELSDIRVIVQVWNNTNAAPGNPVPGGEGRTSVAGEWLSWDRTAVEIDALVEARWEPRNGRTPFVIPFHHVWEPDRGKASMIIRVKNVREGTPVHITVKRINEIAEASSDFFYADDQTREQPGLAGATVSGSQVSVNGANPFVQFNCYAEHWAHPGNNFYAFCLRFGESRTDMVASERDYVNNERACLHMRFTVFIHCAPGSPAVYSDSARALHNFFRGQTKYYRSYLLMGRPSTALDWMNRFRQHYMAFVLTHAACWCEHADHPREIVSGRHRRVVPQPAAPRRGERWENKDLLHSGFPPDRYVCTDQKLADAATARSIRADERHYGRTFGGCGHPEQVHHQNSLMGTSYFDTKAPAGKFRAFSRTAGDMWGMPVATERNGLIVPRLLFWNGGCRTMLTRNFGERMVGGGTRYYHGWVYSPGCDYDQFIIDVMRRWIKGSRNEPAADEFDVERFLPAYRAEAQRGTRPRYHPRIMDSGGVLNASPQPAPDEIENLLR